MENKLKTIIIYYPTKVSPYSLCRFNHINELLLKVSVWAANEKIKEEDIEFEFDVGYTDEYSENKSATLRIYGIRLETEEEQQKRLVEEQRKRDLIKENELQQLAALKAKYEK